jgi:5-methylcytosine-specific restriction endonuclease McrA
MGRQHVIVLNFDYSYLNTVDWKKAVRYILKHKAEIIHTAEDTLRTVDRSLAKPLIVRLLKMVRSVYKKRVPFSYKNVMKRDKHICQYCGSHEDLTIDHVIPKSRGGKNTFENCVTACRTCNHRKGNKLMNEVNMQLRKRPHAPSLIEFLELRLEVHGVAETLKEYWNGAY